MNKVKKSVVKKSKVADKVVAKVSFPKKENARGVVLLAGLKNRQIPLNKVLELAKVKAFADKVSSRPLVGSTTRSMLKAHGYKIECIKALPENSKLWSSVKITK